MHNCAPGPVTARRGVLKHTPSAGAGDKRVSSDYEERKLENHHGTVPLARLRRWGRAG